VVCHPERVVGPLSFAVKLVATVALGAVALAGSVVLLVPAATSLNEAVTPFRDLDVVLNAPATRSVVYDRGGQPMGVFSDEDREPVALADIPQVLIDAVLSIEDRKFYEHNGVDWAGTTRALFKNVDSGGISQGGSTVTQQLVKNGLPAETRERTLKTKVREAILALELERQMSKQEILEDYLNLVYFGNRAYGVKAATERYFGEGADNALRDVTLPQAALLAGLIQLPEGLDPIKNPGPAADRRAVVLDAMVRNGKITQEQANEAKAAPLPTSVYYPVTGELDYYLAEVRTRLVEGDRRLSDDPANALGPDEQTRANALDRDGLQIYTAYDPSIQATATEAVENAAAKVGRYGPEFSAALVVIDNADGGVRAVANGRPFDTSLQFDPAASAKRDSGSTMKVFTLVAALERGCSPEDTVNASPIPNWDRATGKALSSNCKGGTPTLRRALAGSDNCAWVRTGKSLGPGRDGRDGVRVMLDTAAKMGVGAAGAIPKGREEPSNIIGQGVEFSPLVMAQAFSVLANDGVLRPATFVTKIVAKNGKVLWENNPAGTRVLSEQVARTAVDVMKGPVRNGTASGTLGSYDHPAAGKTGTTTSNKDAWFGGFTRQYTAVAWLGDPGRPDDPEYRIQAMPSSVVGGTLPAETWRFVMDRNPLIAGAPKVEFTPPDARRFPPASSVDERGRRAGAATESSSTVPSTPTVPVPSTVPVPTTAPVTTPPTTAPPVTTPPTTASGGGGP